MLVIYARFFSRTEWKPTISRRRMLAATLGASFSAASRSASAFSTHSRNRESRSGSSGFIDDAPILVSWVRNAADKALRSFEAFRPHHDDIHRVSYVPHGAPDRHSPFVGVRRRRFHHQQINVAVLGHLSRGGGPEQNDPVRTRHREDASNNLIQQCFIDVHSVPSYAKSSPVVDRNSSEIGRAS